MTTRSYTLFKRSDGSWQLSIDGQEFGHFARESEARVVGQTIVGLTPAQRELILKGIAPAADATKLRVEYDPSAKHWVLMIDKKPFLSYTDEMDARFMRDQIAWRFGEHHVRMLAEWLGVGTGDRRPAIERRLLLRMSRMIRRMFGPSCGLSQTEYQEWLSLEKELTDERD